jgi:hypothetical protein
VPSTASRACVEERIPDPPLPAPLRSELVEALARLLLRDLERQTGRDAAAEVIVKGGPAA